jgi:hypothetical protein
MHDATVAEVALGLGGEVRIVFTHLTVYESRDATHYDLVSYEAVLTASGVEDRRRPSVNALTTAGWT